MRRMQGRKPLQVVPGRQELLGGGNPKKYLQHTFTTLMNHISAPDGPPHLSDAKRKKESGQGGENQGAGKGAHKRHPQSAGKNSHKHLASWAG